MYLPMGYQGMVNDYWYLKKGVTLWDVGAERQVEITGPDAFKFLQNLTPRNLTNFDIGQCKYVTLTNPDGGILNDPVALRLAKNHFWLSIADRDIWLWAKGLAQGLQMQVTIQEPDASPLAIQGPLSFNVVADLFGNWVREMPYFRFRETEIEGIPIVLARTGWSKQGGYELYLRDGKKGDRLWELVMEAGKPYDIQPGTPSYIERVESGLLNYWQDITDQTNPFEVGLGKLVSLKQEVDYVGKEALKKIKSDGIKRKLVGIYIHSKPLSQNAQPWAIECNGEHVGEITSAIYSPDLDKNIGFAMVDIQCGKPGTKLAIKIDKEKVDATVTSYPFIDNSEKVWAGVIR